MGGVKGALPVLVGKPATSDINVLGFLHIKNFKEGGESLRNEPLLEGVKGFFYLLFKLFVKFLLLKDFF